MGKVYRVEDTKAKEEIALKLLKPEIAADKKTIERFRNELTTARKIRHKNICGMYDIGEENGTYFITMEYVPGEDLKSFLRRSKKLTVETAVSIGKQICEGLNEAHKSGVVHRDLKPGNIMIDTEGNVRIMDFGIARSLSAKAVTVPGTMVGTPEYMSPEQAEGKEVDHRSDIYSLGVILFEMVTGQPPFEGDSPLSVAMKHKSELPVHPKTLNPQISPDFNRLILMCLEKNRDKRWQSAWELMTELEKVSPDMPAVQKDILKKRPRTSKEITVTFGMKRLLFPALILFVIIVSALFLWHPWSQKSSAPPVSDKTSLAVLYFDNNTGDAGLDHWRKLFSDELVTDLAQSKYLRVLPRDELYEILESLDQLETTTFSSSIVKEVAIRGNVDHIVLGTFARMGETIRIEINIQEPKTGEIIGSERVEANGEEDIFPQIDELTRRIKSHLNLTEKQIAQDLDKEIGQITTKSPQALKYYSEAFRFVNKGEVPQALQLFHKAVEVDPDFAKAYIGLAGQYLNMGDTENSIKYARKAFELRDRLSEEEKLYTEASYYFLTSEKNWNKVLEADLKYLALYPDSSHIYGDLGFDYWNMEDWDKAIEYYEICMKKYPNLFAFQISARCYAYKEMFDRAEAVLKNYLRDQPDNAKAHNTFCYIYSLQGKFDLALEEVEKAYLLDPEGRSHYEYRGDIYFYKGDLDKAEQEYKKLVAKEERTGSQDGRRCLSDVYILEGKFRKAIEQLEMGLERIKESGQSMDMITYQIKIARAKSLSGRPEEAIQHCLDASLVAGELGKLHLQMRSLHIKGLVHLSNGAMSEAERTADELKELADQHPNKRLWRYYYDLAGRIELDRGNFSRSLEHFKKALNLNPYAGRATRAFHLDSQAFAYYTSHEFNKAKEVYERILSLTWGRFDYGDIYAKAFYMLGKINEQLGEKAEAIANYEKFLDLWKDADPGIAEVEDARERLANLTSNQ